MTIESIVDLAYEHFLKNQYTGDEIREIIKKHAIEELNLSEEDAEAFAWKSEPDIKDEIDSSGLEDFYPWYYFNYVQQPDATAKDSPPLLRPVSQKGRLEFRFYAVIKVAALVDQLPFDDVLQQWMSNCIYEIAGNDRLWVIGTEFHGASLEDPLL